MRGGVGVIGWAVCLSLSGIAEAKPISAAMAFAARVIENEPAKAAAMISGPVEQAANAKFLPTEQASGKQLFEAVSDCKFFAIYDEMPSANFPPDKRPIQVAWLCSGKRVLVTVVPFGDKVILKYLSIMPIFIVPPALAKVAN